MLWKMDVPEIYIHDNYAPVSFGLDLPERLMWEAFVVRQDITRQDGWETGRPSEPAFQDMNLQAVRSDTPPKPVIWQFDVSNPTNPCGFLIAYEEERVMPVVSDIDPFLIGAC